MVFGEITPLKQDFYRIKKNNNFSVSKSFSVVNYENAHDTCGHRHTEWKF